MAVSCQLPLSDSSFSKLLPSSCNLYKELINQQCDTIPQRDHSLTLMSIGRQQQFFAPNLGFLLFDALGKAEPLMLTAACHNYDIDLCP